MKTGLFISAFAVIGLPLAAWVFYKPGRVIAPGLAGGITCVTATICLDDESRFPQANALYRDAFRFVDSSLGPFRKRPRVIFCATETCFRPFGFASTAGTVGTWGIVIGPRGWPDYYVRHEMIHHRQSEELGFISQLRDPVWLIEGMAYSLSEDPRRPLGGHWEADRAEFEAWLRKTGKQDMWSAARKL